MFLRKVEIMYAKEFQNAVEEISRSTVDNAVGYLVTWSITNENYCNLFIYGTKEGSLVATYRNASGEVTYSIFAQRPEDDNGIYSFHS